MNKKMEKLTDEKKKIIVGFFDYHFHQRDKLDKVSSEADLAKEEYLSKINKDQHTIDSVTRKWGRKMYIEKQLENLKEKLRKSCDYDEQFIDFCSNLTFGLYNEYYETKGLPFQELSCEGKAISALEENNLEFLEELREKVVAVTQFKYEPENKLEVFF